MAFAHAAHALVGCPFRLHGRDPLRGLDCLGVVAVALREIGVTTSAIPQDYSLRRIDMSGLVEDVRKCGFNAASDELLPGDLLLVQPGPGQHHFMVAGPHGALVHAHGGLRRVVTTPAPSPWVELNRWRLED